MHHETASLGEEVDKLSAVVRKLAAKVMWIAGTPITGGVKSVPRPEIDALLARVASRSTTPCLIMSRVSRRR